jgi:hypothetical protein
MSTKAHRRTAVPFGGRVLRTEVCINDPADFGVRKSLVHLEYLKRIANHTFRALQTITFTFLRL